MVGLLGLFLIAQVTYIDLHNDGQAFFESGNMVEAEDRFERAAALNPVHVPTLKSLAKLYARQKRYTEAIELLIDVVAIAPREIDVRHNLAEIYSWTGDHDKAIVTFKDALEVAPGDSSLKIGLARVFRWSHRYSEAERYYMEVLAVSPEDHHAMMGLAKTHALKGDFPSALAMLDSAIEIYTEDAELYKERGTVRGWQHDFDGALADIKKAIELKPDYLAAHITLGDVYDWQKDYKGSIEAYKKAATLYPGNINAYIYLSQVYLKMDMVRLAEESAKNALKIEPANETALHLLRETREKKKLPIVKTFSRFAELSAFLFVLTTLFLTYRSRRKLLKRKHVSFFYFANIVLPLLILITLASLFARGTLAGWIEPDIVKDITEAFLFAVLGFSFIALLLVDRTSGTDDERVILVIGAHPDDIELGCGGFVMKAKDRGAKVYGLTVTKGENGWGRSGSRLEELARASKYMRLDAHWVLDFEDSSLQDSIGPIKNAIEKKVKETGATMVVTHTPLDIHSDHKAVFEASKEGARNVSIYCYEDVSSTNGFVPNYFDDISGYIVDKVKIVGMHKSQSEKSYTDPELIKGRAAHRGLQSGVHYAEAFRIYKMVR